MQTGQLVNKCHYVATANHISLLAAPSSPITEASSAKRLPFLPSSRWDHWVVSCDNTLTPQPHPSHTYTHAGAPTRPQHRHTQMPLTTALFSWCTCLPALQASSTPIKGAELFSSQKLIQHLSPGFIVGIESCVECGCECIGSV